MKNVRKLIALLLALFVVTLVGCQLPGNTNNPTGPGENETKDYLDSIPTEFDHYYSNQISFADMNIDLADNKFIANKVAKLKLKSVTDGDTAVFHLDGEMDGYTNSLGRSYAYLTVRFLAIDTPESTSSIAPWGKKASNFAKEKLENAEGIIVDATSIDTSDQDVYPDLTSTYKSGCRLDSNGTRWLGLIWYCPNGMDPSDLNNYRSYQLDMIEECYSFYTGSLYNGFEAKGLNCPYPYSANKTLEPKLYSRYEKVDGISRYGSMTLGEVMFEADMRMQELKARKTGGEIDPNYDYSKTPTKATITEAHQNFDDWMNNAKFVELTGVITAFIGNNFYFEDANGSALYVYMGLDSKKITSLFSVGDTIAIRGRLATFGGQRQMSDIVWAKDTFVKVTGEGEIAMPTPIQLTSADLNTNVLDQYMGRLVTITVNAESTGNPSKDKSYTLYTGNAITGNVDPDYSELSIRINGTLFPGYEYDEFESYWDNKTVTVTGIMSTYLEADIQSTINLPSYQIVVGNRVKDGDNYLSDIVIK